MQEVPGEFSRMDLPLRVSQGLGILLLDVLPGTPRRSNAGGRQTDVGEDLAGTVEAYLDLGGDAKRTAEQLRLHRATLYYRLAKAAQLTGADLRNGHDRLALHLGFKLARLNGSYPSSGSSGLEPRPVRVRPGRRQRTGQPD